MGYGKISKKQSEILEFIKDSILTKGYPPAVREICEAVHLKSTSSVHSHLETLEKNGYIRRDPTKPRAEYRQLFSASCRIRTGRSVIRIKGKRRFHDKRWYLQRRPDFCQLL